MKNTLNFKKKFNKLYIIAIIFIASFLSIWLISRQSSHNINKLTRQEKKDLNTFLEYLLLREHGIYVLFGSKPVVVSNLCIISKERLKKNYENIPQKIKEQANRNEIRLNFTIQSWEQIQKFFKIKENYLLFFKKYEDIGIADVYFVNKSNLISILSKHHKLFKKRTNIDFDPLTIINEFDDENSKFWCSVKKDIVLQGLIFGYGKTNSILFEKWLKTDPQKKQNLENLGFSITSNHLIDANIKVKYLDFPLPVFRSFQNDITLEKYKKEREKIISIYKGKDPLKVTMKKLCKSY